MAHFHTFTLKGRDLENLMRPIDPEEGNYAKFIHYLQSCVDRERRQMKCSEEDLEEIFKTKTALDKRTGWRKIQRGGYQGYLPMASVAHFMPSICPLTAGLATAVWAESKAVAAATKPTRAEKAQALSKYFYLKLDSNRSLIKSDHGIAARALKLQTTDSPNGYEEVIVCFDCGSYAASLAQEEEFKRLFKHLNYRPKRNSPREMYLAHASIYEYAAKLIARQGGARIAPSALATRKKRSKSSK